MTTHLCAQAINQPLCVGGIERKLFGLSLAVSGVIAARLSQVIGAVVCVALLWGAKRLTRKDDRMVEIAWRLCFQKDHYDPFKRKVFELEIVEEKLEEE
jgi:type IV secretory pathway VirB3-like protein